MSKLKKMILITLIVVLAIAAMIFVFSAQSGEDSSKASGRVTEAVLSLLMPGFRQLSPAEKRPYLATWGKVIRKLAHFTEYALLGFALVVHLKYRLRDSSLPRVCLIAWLVATLYAGTDELHQLFIANRSAAVTDVLIDSAGAVVGTLFGALRQRLRHRRHVAKPVD